MLETPTNTCLKKIYDKAHKERADAFAALWVGLLTLVTRRQKFQEKSDEELSAIRADC